MMLNFIFASCTMVYPSLSALCSSNWGWNGKARLISISIDPDHNTPQQLTDYWRRFGAGPQCQLPVGRRDDMVKIQKAFEVYPGKKPVTNPPLC